MLVDLIQVTTRDGIRLDGVFQDSPNESDSPFPDAVCMIHGTGGNFYSSSMFDHLANEFLKRGVNVLRVNTRGHDLISTAVTLGGGMRQGAAYERVDDCRQDVVAWISWLKDHRYERIALLGHSSGAVKALYAVAHEMDLPVDRVIAVSPPRLSYSWFCESAKRQIFLDTYRQAEILVQTGRPEALMEVAFPLPFVVTAAGYLEKYGPDEKYNFLHFISSIRIPALLTLGTIEMENNAAFQGIDAALEGRPRRSSGLEVEIIDGADHFYSDARPGLAKAIMDWLKTAAD